MLELLERLNLVDDGVVCRAARVAKLPTLEVSLVHRFDRVLLAVGYVLTKHDFGEAAGANFPYKFIIINLLSFAGLVLLAGGKAAFFDRSLSLLNGRFGAEDTA